MTTSSRENRALIVALSAVALVAAPLASSAEAEDAASRDVQRRLEELERRNSALEKSNEELKGRLAELERKKAPDHPGEREGTDHPAGQEGEAPDEREETLGLGLVGKYGNVKVHLQLFGDFDFGYRTPHPRPVANNAFVLGALDLFVSGSIGDHFQALSELVVEGDSDSGEVGIDLERFWAKWAFNDLLYLKLGVEHTPCSRWNRLYHHGRWLWIPATSPFLARFEDEAEGLLPVHVAGLEGGGRIDAPFGVVEYVLGVGNGRGWKPEERALVFDRNAEKAFFASVSLGPVTGLTFGGSFYADEIPRDGSDPARARQVRELIASAFAEVKVGNLEALGELTFIAHKDRVGRRTYHHRAGYVQVAYRAAIAPAGELVPFARFDLVDARPGDPFYGPANRDLDRWLQLFGVRWDVISNVALKLEGGFGREQVRDPDGGVLSRRWYGVVQFQIAWVF